MGTIVDNEVLAESTHGNIRLGQERMNNLKIAKCEKAIQNKRKANSQNFLQINRHYLFLEKLLFMTNIQINCPWLV